MNGLRVALGVLGLGLLVSACQPTRSSSTDQPSSAASASPVPEPLVQSPPTSSPSVAAPSVSPTLVAPRPTITAPPPAAPSQAVEQPQEPAALVATPESPPGTDTPLADPTASPEPIIPITSTFRQPDGLFEISFPDGYSFRRLDDGVSFISRDGTFGGSANVLSAEGQTLTNELLELGLKEEYMNRLKAVEWQASTVQADGSLRIDWVGVDTNGDVLDSVSFVEQHGDRIYILNLHAINEAYANYEADATIIVENYRLLWDE